MMDDSAQAKSPPERISLVCTLSSLVVVTFGFIAALMIQEDIISSIMLYLFPILVLAGFVSGVIAVIKHGEWFGLLVNILLLLLALIVGSK